MKKPSKRFLLILAIIVCCFTIIALWSTALVEKFPHSKASYTHRDLFVISKAISRYQKEFNTEPPVMPKKFYASMGGKNPKKIRFLSKSKYQEEQTKLRCDAWLTPYQIYRSGSGWLIRSAGPDRTFDDIGGEYKDPMTDDMTIFVPVAILNMEGK